MALPYVLNNGNLSKFLKHIQTAKVPTKLDYSYLEQAGFKGKNDRYLTTFLKALGFTDAAGIPTQRWHDHRNTAQGPGVIATAIQEAWSGYFDMYADAHARADDDFKNWARDAEPKASEVTVNRSLGSFKTAVKLGDFSSTPASTPASPAVPHASPAAPPPATPLAPGKVSVGTVGGLTINIELQLPATADAKFFDQFFASMRKHLLDVDE
ncbi:MAG: DUF5343 domain-containing protein [Acidimicrobiia bacterium]|jgi:hypothetical protein|nr:DUF5343 domain-containing protein [Acidimicrobiia bacterium]